ncbi:hypothetical protein N665_0157s0147 [Sinapis alba]|nr:hypothetical protein N665_0157s0147 [Sinapis alba]
MIAARTKRLSRLQAIMLTPRGVGKINVTCGLRDLGIQMIALPSREHVTMLS